MKRVVISLILLILSVCTLKAKDLPINDTKFMMGAFCYQTSIAPVFVLELTSEEKSLGQSQFFDELHERSFDESDFIKMLGPLQKRYAAWVVPNYKGKSHLLLKWYRENCLD